MNYTQCTVDTNVIAQLADSPTQSPAELKAAFDKVGSDLKQYINAILLEELNKEDSELSKRITANATAITRNQNALFDNVYPIGSIYMSVNNTNPATLFGGTWEQLKDRFLLGAGSTYSNGSTGGAATVALTVANLPSHTHTVGAHSHGLNSHTHTYSNAASATGAAAGNTGSTVLTVNQIPDHYHTIMPSYGAAATSNTANEGKLLAGARGNAWFTASTPGTNHVGGGQGHTHTLNSHTHTISKSTANTGAAAGSTANSTAFNSGATGSGTAVNKMPPYLTVYMWKRTA